MRLRMTQLCLGAAALLAAAVSSCSSKNGLSGYSIGSSKLPACTSQDVQAAASSGSAPKNCTTDDTLNRSAVMSVDTVTGLPTCDATRKGAIYYVSATKSLQNCDGSKWQVINSAGPAGPAGPAGVAGPAGEAAPITISNYYTDTGSISTVVESGKQISRTTTRFWTAKNGTLIKTCTTDTWTEPTGVANGFKSFTRQYLSLIHI